MAVVADVVRNFQWVIEINGLDQWLIQEISGISSEFEKVIYNDVGEDVERPGRPKSGDISFKKVIRAKNSDNWAWEMLRKIFNGVSYSTPADYMGTWTLKLLNPDNTVARRYALTEAWVQKVELDDLARGGNEAAMDSVTLSVRRIYTL